ncbi:MAG: EamA family transporter [Desulfobaccales bacterium]
MNWLGYSLIALGLWGLWGFFCKVATLELPPVAAYLLSIAGHLAVIGYLAGTGSLAIPWQAAGVAAGLGAGLCMAFGLLFFFKAMAGGTAAAVVPVTALYPLVTVILSWTLLHESVTLRHVAGVALALTAVWLLSK